VIDDEVLTSLIYTVEVIFTNSDEYSFTGQTNANVIAGQTTSSYNDCIVLTPTPTRTPCAVNQPILLRYHPSSGALSCSQSPSTYYTFDNTNYATTDRLFTNNNCTGVAIDGYYSNGIIVRYWNGTNLGAPVGCN
jgi:hypothetical protein